MMSTPRIALAAAAALLVLTAGCGAADEPEAAPPADTSNVGAATAALSAPRGTDGSVSKAGFIADLLAAIDSHDTVHLSVQAGSMGSGEADVSYADGRTQVEVDYDLALRGPGRLVISDGAVYIEQSQGGKWLKIDKNDPAYGRQLTTYTKIGPHESVAGLGKGLVSVVRDGTRTVDGVELAKYRAKVDPNKAEGALKALAGSSGVSDDLVFDLYVDGSGLLRLIETTAGGEKATVALTGWGEPVSITVPSADQLVGS